MTNSRFVVLIRVFTYPEFQILDDFEDALSANDAARRWAAGVQSNEYWVVEIVPNESVRDATIVPRPS